jgi:hypothetical protein
MALKITRRAGSGRVQGLVGSDRVSVFEQKKRAGSGFARPEARSFGAPDNGFVLLLAIKLTRLLN